MLYISFDFSTAKPAVFVYDQNKDIHIYSFPKDLSKPNLNKLQDLGINVILQDDFGPKPTDSSDLMIYHFKSAQSLSDKIVDALHKHVVANEDGGVYVANEGFSFASTGNSMLELAGYKYILLQRLYEKLNIPFNRTYTYAPISVKKTAESSKKGKTKDDVILSSTKYDISHPFFESLKTENTSLKTEKGNYIKCVDDIVDSFFVLCTMLRVDLKILPKDLYTFFKKIT